MVLDDSNSEILEILNFNQGFTDPVHWIDYARENGFAKVRARLIPACPDCGSDDNFIIGQYIYYSQLIRLKRCQRCDLRFSDVLIDKSTIKEHFEHTYKDETYFESERRSIFEHLARLICKRLPPGTTIMDAGGALGHLAHIIQNRDTGYDICVSDISQTACDYANKKFGLSAFCCTIEGLSRLQKQFDALLLVDVLYYVGDICQAWQSISETIKPGGYCVIRFPNKLWRTDLVQWLRKLRPRKHPETSVHGINCEQVLFFSRKYLRQRMI